MKAWRHGVEREGCALPSPQALAILQFADVPIQRPHMLFREFRLLLGESAELRCQTQNARSKGSAAHPVATIVSAMEAKETVQ